MLAVLTCAKLEWKEPDVEGLVDFLVREKGFMCVTTTRPFHSLTFHVHLGRIAYGSHVRNSQRPSIQNNKDALTASSL